MLEQNSEQKMIFVIVCQKSLISTLVFQIS